MTYLIKNKDSGIYQEIPDILKFDKNKLKTEQLFIANEITEEQFDDQIKNIHRMVLLREIEEKQKKLSELGIPTTPVVVPTVQQPINTLTSSVPAVSTTINIVNPATKKPYTKDEVISVFNMLQEEVNKSEGEGIFEHVMWVENEGTYFKVIVNQMNPSFPRQIRNIPIQQILDPATQNFGNGLRQ